MHNIVPAFVYVNLKNKKKTIVFIYIYQIVNKFTIENN